jgi:hypothetical protein
MPHRSPAASGTQQPAPIATLFRARRAAYAVRAHAILRQLDTDLAAIAVILALTAAAFSPWWLHGRVLAPFDVLHETFAPWRSAGGTAVDVHNHFTSDALTQYVVYRRFAERSFAEDGGIGWSTLTNGGRPEYANTMALYGDWTMQLHRVLDFWTAWHVGLMATLLIGAFGMFVLLRSRQSQPLVALAGAVAFTASTPLVFTLYHRWHLAAFAWVPWLAWAVLATGEGRRRLWVLPPVFLALALLGGSLQTAAFVLLVWVALWVHAVQRAGMPHAAGITGRFLLWGVLGVGLAGFVLVPGIEMYIAALDLHGERSSIGYPGGWRQVVGAFAFLPLQLFPTLLGSPRSLDLAKLFHVELTQIAFFGVVPMVFAVVAAIRGRVPLAARVLIGAGLLLPLTPLVGPLYHRVQLVFVFGGAWAFAHAWQHSGVSSTTVRRLTVATAALLGAWLLASLALLAFEARLTALLESQVAAAVSAGAGGPLAGFTDWYAARAARLVAELRIWSRPQAAAVAGLLLGLAALRLRARGGLRGATALLVVALVMELGSLTTGWHAFIDPARYPPYPPHRDLEAVRATVGSGTVYIAAEHSGPALFLPPNTLAMYDIRTIQQFETVDVPGMWQESGRSTDAGVLGRLGVTHAVAPPGRLEPPGWRLVRRGESVDLWANVTAAPRYLAVPDGSNVDEAVFAAVAGRTGPAVLVRDATMNRRVLEVSAAASAVRIAENWSRGWQYREDGGAFRDAVQAPDRSMVLPLHGAVGLRLVEMRYDPPARRLGRTLSGLALLVTLAAGAFALRPRRAVMEEAGQ